MSNLKYFKGSLIFSACAFVAAYFIGGPMALFSAFVLSVMEVSLSFDNAVVNATVLGDMSEVWRKRFITWGMLIAVFGMRLLFPIIVVCVAGMISPIQAFDIAIHDHAKYVEYLDSANVPLMGFGSAFLLLVALEFFLDSERDTHWISFIEKPFAMLSNIAHEKFFSIATTIIALVVVGLIGLDRSEFLHFVAAGLAGVVAHEIISFISGFMESKEEELEASGANVAKSGLALFLYLEMLDASFSFDGVIGSFAISHDIFIIALGLGVGAMFVRSLTIMLVEKGTLTEYKYLEHGAFYAIITLAVLMMLKSFIDIPDVVTGLIGAGFIGAAFVTSLLAKNEDEVVA